MRDNQEQGRHASAGDSSGPVSAGGYFYYSAVNAAALKEAERQARVRLEILTKSISSFLLENTKVVRSLAGMDVLSEALSEPGQALIESANSMLDHFRKTLEVDVCYLMDANGTTIASSNRRDADSFVGKNFSFRPYFKKAENALEKAKEELSRYSRDLERQVQLRTKEISGILKCTPAIVYFKDSQGASR
jgi:hypothetical protein